MAEHRASIKAGINLGAGNVMFKMNPTQMQEELKLKQDRHVRQQALKAEIEREIKRVTDAERVTAKLEEVLKVSLEHVNEDLDVVIE
jgi:hypothetical protein